MRDEYQSHMTTAFVPDVGFVTRAALQKIYRGPAICLLYWCEPFGTVASQEGTMQAALDSSRRDGWFPVIVILALVGLSIGLGYWSAWNAPARTQASDYSRR